MKELPSVEEILSQYVYDPVTGLFKHAYPKRGRRRADGTAGFSGPNKYVYLRVSGKVFLAHRLAWKIVYGIDPNKEIDHIDTVRTNNSIANLRLATEAQQCWNCGALSPNKTGFKGIYYIEKKNRWVARISIERKIIYLGMYKKPEFAHAAYVAAVQRYHGEFANLGACVL